MERPYIPRKHYLDRIIPFINKEIIKIFVGQRRVGKSYLLLQIFDYLQETFPECHVIYINKELPRFSQINTSSELIGYVKANAKGPGTNFLLIDEIQDIENFHIALRGLLAEGGFDIYCTGSNAAMLSADTANLLGGRYIQIHVHSLSYNEFLQFHSLSNNQEALLSYMRFGGLPYLHHLELEENTITEYLKSIYNSIILRDVVVRYNVRNIPFLESLNHFLADNTGSLLSAKRISDFLKSQRVNISTKLVLEYLQYLEHAFFIKKAKRFDIKGRKVFEINDKFYFTDLGLRNVLQPFQMKDINKLLENLVYNKLLQEDYNVYVGKLHDQEIDFVALKENHTVYIQVVYLLATKQVHEREFGNLLGIKDNHRKIVVSMDEFPESNYKGIEHIHIRNFLSSSL